MEEIKFIEESKPNDINECECNTLLLKGLKYKEKVLDAVFQVANLGICITNEEGIYTMVNEAYCKMYGYTQEELLGKLFTIILSPEDKEGTLSNYKYLMQNDVNSNYELKVINKKGESLNVYVTAGNFINEDGQKLRVTTVTDITKVKDAYHKLNMLTQGLENAREGIVFTSTDPTNIIFANDAFFEIVGFNNNDVIKAKNNLLELGVYNIEFYNYILNKLKQEEFWQGEVIGVKKNKEKYMADLTIRAIKGSNGEITNYLGILNKLTYKKNAEKKIQYLKNYSIVTNLPNRQVLEERIAKLEDQTELKEKVALILIDINKFRSVNESFGFNVGNKLLKEIGYRIRNKIKNEDFLAYLGEDDFVILTKEIKDENEVLSIAEDLLKSLIVKYVIDKNEIIISCTIGISIYNSEKKINESLISKAEKAILDAKKQGINSIQIYTEEMNMRMSRKHQIEIYIKKCIVNKEIFLKYQPQIELRKEKVIGVEALLRWKHPAYGFIPPSEFITIAEEIGLINEIGNWVFETAFCEAVKLHKMGFADLKISVNLSPLQLNENNFIETFMRIIKESGIDPKLVELEITEGIMMHNLEKGVIILNKLKELGVSIALDDFGTGYSSLSNLRKIPIDKLKIDRSFISDYKIDQEEAIITKTIIDMGKNLGLKVLVEGAETKDQIQYLKTNGCDQVQGYYYSKPLLFEELQEYLKKYG